MQNKSHETIDWYTVFQKVLNSKGNLGVARYLLGPVRKKDYEGPDTHGEILTAVRQADAAVNRALQLLDARYENEDGR